MSVWSVLNESVAAALVARWTALLTLAWLGHWALGGRNPRWRVGLWRAAVVGLAVIGLLTFVPPVLTIPVAPAVERVLVPSNIVLSTPQRPVPDPGRGASI